MKIAYLGAGTWGTALAVLLAANGHEVVVWTRSRELNDYLSRERQHPKLKDFILPREIQYVTNLEETLNGAEMIVESVTSAGFRSVFENIRAYIHTYIYKNN